MHDSIRQYQIFGIMPYPLHAVNIMELQFEVIKTDGKIKIVNNIIVGVSLKGDSKFKYMALQRNGKYRESNLVTIWDKKFSTIAMRDYDRVVSSVEPSKVIKIGCPVKVDDDVIAYKVKDETSAYQGKWIFPPDFNHSFQ